MMMVLDATRRPTTVVKWLRKGFRIYWPMAITLPEPAESERRNDEIRDLIRRISLANPFWLDQTAVGSRPPRHARAPSPIW
jgi:hypothetical protein